MIRVKMPLLFRMQNFLLTERGIFWTSASKTLWQKITKRGNYCNTSGGFTLPFHGQTIRYSGGKIVKYGWPADKQYDLATGKYLGEQTRTASNFGRISSFSPKVQQGVAYAADEPKYTVFGSAGKKSIEIYNLSGVLLAELFYKNYAKWYWKHWEAEGLQIDNNGKLWVGINVKTIFGVHLNYIHKVDGVHYVILG